MQLIAQWNGHGFPGFLITVETNRLPYLGYAFMIGMVAIKRQLIPNPHSNENNYRHTRCQACNIYKSMCFAPGKVSPGYFQVIALHTNVFMGDAKRVPSYKILQTKNIR